MFLQRPETPVCRVPQNIVSVVDHQSDATATRVSCVDQDSVSAADCNSVSGERVSGKQVLESCMANSPQICSCLRRVQLLRPPTTVACLRNHHKRRATLVPAHAGITRPKFQQPYSRLPVLEAIPATILSNQQNPLVPVRLVEILAKEGMKTIHAYGKEEEFGAVTERGDSLLVVASRPGAMSCRRRGWLFRVVGHMVSCASSAMSACPLERGALCSLAPRKLHQQTLEHFLVCVAKRISLILNDTQMTTSLTIFSNVPLHVWGAALPWQHTDGCLHSQLPPVLATQ